MANGGIYSIATHFSRHYLRPERSEHGCYMCRSKVDPAIDLFIDWATRDAYLHRTWECFVGFLVSPEGRELVGGGCAVVLPAMVQCDEGQACDDPHDDNILPDWTHGTPPNHELD